MIPRSAGRLSAPPSKKFRDLVKEITLSAVALDSSVTHLGPEETWVCVDRDQSVAPMFHV